MNGHRLRVLKRILRNTGADKVMVSYTGFVLVDALLIWVTEPTIRTYREALWYCYAVISTAGFGDVVVTHPLPRILSFILTAYSVLVIAIVTGVVVNYYTNMIEIKNKETITAVLDQMERLPELSKEELKELSARVSKMRGNNRFHAPGHDPGGPKTGYGS